MDKTDPELLQLLADQTPEIVNMAGHIIDAFIKTYLANAAANAQASSNTTVIIAAAIGVAGTLLGMVGTYMIGLRIEKNKLASEVATLQASLLIEISTLLEIIEHRAYVKTLQDTIKYLEINPDEKVSIKIHIPAHYSRIYQSHAARIGMLPQETATAIAKFHQLLDASYQDFLPSGLISNGASASAFNENLHLLSNAISIGKALTHNKIKLIPADSTDISPQYDLTTQP